MAQLISIHMPEGGAEHGVIYSTHHRCAQANALVRMEGFDEDIDLIVFAVGIVGYGMPRGEPFAVEAQGPCHACGRTLTAGFVWTKGAGREGPGTIWTP